MAINKKTYKVKGCPFCGSNPKIVTAIGCGAKPEKDQYYVVCGKGMDHHVRMGASIEFVAVERWNSRSSSGKVFELKSKK